jgi:hypothetical protein
MAPWSEPHFCTRLHTPRRTLDFQYTLEPVTFRGKSKHHALVLLVAPRPEDKLASTIESLKLGGLDSWIGPKIVFADGYTGELPSDWIHARLPVVGGSAVAFVSALRYATANDPNLESLTLIEDDIEVCKHALDYMARVTVPRDVAFVSWFTYDYDFSFPCQQQLQHPSLSSGPVLAIRSSRYFILTQACTFSRATIDRLLACPHITGSWPKLNSHDEMIGWALGDALYAVHFPILVQHTGGLNSAVLLSRGTPLTESDDPQASARTSPFFAGSDFDTRLLLPLSD